MAKSLEFRNLPLVEAVVRVYFANRIRVDFGLVSELHTKIHSEFPNVIPLSVWELTPALQQETQLPIPRGDLPGAEYTGGQHGLSVHLQPQLIAVRWRRGITEHSPEYPRFQKLRRFLESCLRTLRDSSSVQQIQLALTNMTYVNFIRVEDPRPYLKEEYSTRATLTAKTLQEQVVAWQAQNDIDLRFEVRGAERSLGPQKEAGYLVTTAAGRRLEPSDDPLAFLDAVHGELQVLFADLVSERAKSEWGLHNDNSK